MVMRVVVEWVVVVVVAVVVEVSGAMARWRRDGSTGVAAFGGRRARAGVGRRSQRTLVVVSISADWSVLYGREWRRSCCT